MPGKRLWMWTAVVIAVGAVLWYRSENMPDSAESSPSVASRVVFVTGGSGDFWKLTVKGAEAAAKDFNADLRVEMLDQEEAHVQQLKLLVKLHDADIDGIAVSPLDAEGQT